MHNKILIFLCICFISFCFGQNEIQGYINDPDGYTNIRESANIKAKVVGKLFEAELFIFVPDSNSSWWKIKTNNMLEGFVHRSRIKSIDELTIEIVKFLKYFSGFSPNNVHNNEEGNEEMFGYAQKYPLSFIDALSKMDKIIKIHIAEELETPIHDLIDLELIYERINNVNKSNETKSLILKSINVAGSKLGLKIGE